MEKVNVIHHMNEFRNILSYATNIGFFFGAGTSCAFGLPNIMTLTDECKSRLSTIEQQLFGKIEKTIENLEGKKVISIEDVLSHIRQIRDITQGREDYAFDDITGEQAAELDKKICEAVFYALLNEMSSYATAHMNMCVMSPGKVIISGIEREWEYDDSADADVGHELYWDQAKKEFILGDFRKLIEFFIENSGRKSMIEEITNAK